MTTSTSFPALERDGWAGKKLGRFEVLCKLGVGGMSEVFLAWQKAVGGFQRPVVLKRILESVKTNEEFLRMFVKEAKITSSLSHGGIAHLYELAHDDGELFMVMEFVPGATLVEVARACHTAKEPIPIGFTLSVVYDTAIALQYAHTFADATGRTRPVIHRDVAEKNIMVGLDGSTKLLDFGIARQTDSPGMTQVGTVKGTAGYMSPEQVRGEKLDGRTDVFSLGVVLHECLTGQRLFRRNTVQEEVQALLEAPIFAPSQKNREVPIEVDAVVMKALSRDRNHRFQSAKDMAEAVTAAGGHRLWDKDRRGGFIRRHFERRQADITALLGDPSSTDLGDLLPEPRITRDEVRTVTARSPSPLGEERTVEARTAKAPSLSEPRLAPVREGRVVTSERMALSGRKTPLRNADLSQAGDEPETVLGLPPAVDDTEDPDVKTVSAAASGGKKSLRRTEPALDSMAETDQQSRDTQSPGSLEEPGTMIEDPVLTDERSPQPQLAPGGSRRKSKHLDTQKQALLMWIAIGSGLLLGVVLAAFLIFG